MIMKLINYLKLSLTIMLMFYNNTFSAMKEQFSQKNQLVYFARGKRSIIYKAVFEGNECIIKVEKQDIGAMNRIANEKSWLEKLNHFSIGPKLFGYGEDFLIMELIDGKKFIDWLPDADTEEIKLIVIELLRQCRKLDCLNVNKEEMHNPFKHIIIRKNKPVMIDFERCHNTLKPKNVTQFFQYLTSKRLEGIFQEKGLNFEKAVIELKEYKSSYSEESFAKLLEKIRN